MDSIPDEVVEVILEFTIPPVEDDDDEYEAGDPAVAEARYELSRSFSLVNWRWAAVS